MRLHASQGSSLLVLLVRVLLSALLTIVFERVRIRVIARQLEEVVSPVIEFAIAHLVQVTAIVLEGDANFVDPLRDLAPNAACLTTRRAPGQIARSHLVLLLLLNSHRSEDHLPVVVVVLVDRVGPLGSRGDLGLLLTWRPVEQLPIPPRTHRAHPSDPDFRDLAALSHDFLLTRKRFAQPLSYPPSEPKTS